MVPIMGWSSWNHFRIAIDEDIILAQAEAMARNGMADAGYGYINIDDGYFGGRDETGRLFADPETFPSGMKALADAIHALGLRAGIYSDAGRDTCGSEWDGDKRGFGVGLFGHEEADLKQMLVEWGYDFIKVDWCGGKRQQLDEQKTFTRVGRIIRRLRPDVVYNVCRWQFPGEWVGEVADSWRVSGDITPDFDSICRIIDLNEPLWRFAGPGRFNDMDMLQVGRGMTPDEDRAHFSMWCMMASPLLAGNDLRTMNAETLAILTNKDLIAIQQDPLVSQARRLRDEGDLELWVRPLASAEGSDLQRVAVTLFNRSDAAADMSFSLAEVGLDAEAAFTLFDCWSKEQRGSEVVEGTWKGAVPAHGVVVLKVEGQSLSGLLP
jgi:hypothetical protein